MDNQDNNIAIIDEMPLDNLDHLESLENYAPTFQEEVAKRVANSPLSLKIEKYLRNI